MISTAYTTTRAPARGRNAARTMKSLRTDRIGYGSADPSIGIPARRGQGWGRGDRGFSIIELMVVLAVVGALAVVAAAGFRRNEFANQRTRFIADVEGMLVQARNAAVDRQTRVRVSVDATSVTLTAFDTADDTWRPLNRAALENPNGSLVTVNDAVCLYGFTPGVQAPSQASAVSPPADCVGEPQLLVFESDGRFSDPDATFSAVPNAGATLWIADRTIPGAPKYTILQIFPGGLIRKFDQLD